jgi:hypothetical protein
MSVYSQLGHYQNGKGRLLWARGKAYIYVHAIHAYSGVKEAE